MFQKRWLRYSLILIFCVIGQTSVFFAQTGNNIEDDAQLALDSGNFKRALKIYTQLASKNPTNVNYLSFKAYCHFQCEEYFNCVNSCNKGLLLKPKLFDKYYLIKVRAFANEELGQWEDALKGYEDYLGLYYDDEEITYRRAFTYYRQKKYNEAIVNFNYVLKLKNITQQYRMLSYSKIGFCYLNMDSVSLAMEYCDKAIATDPAAVNPRFLNASIQKENKAYTESINQYREILKMDSTSYSAYIGMSESFNTTFFSDSAFYYLKIYQEKAGSDADFLYAMAETESTRKNTASALKYFKAYLKEVPNSSEAFNNVAWGIMLLGNYAESLLYANKSIQLNKSNFYAYDTRGTIKYRLKLYADAIKDFDKALSISTPEPNSYYFRGLAYLKMKQGSKACSDWQMAKQFKDYETLPGEKAITTLIDENCK